MKKAEISLPPYTTIVNNGGNIIERLGGVLGEETFRS